MECGRRSVFFGLGALVLASPALAQRVERVARGAPMRTELLDAMRPLFEEATGGPVEFVVRKLNVVGRFAYAEVTPQRPGGRPIDWRQTRLREAARTGTMSNISMVLLEQSGRAWLVAEYVIGPTDVAWIPWAEARRLPEALFE